MSHMECETTGMVASIVKTVTDEKVIDSLIMEKGTGDSKLFMCTVCEQGWTSRRFAAMHILNVIGEIEKANEYEFRFDDEDPPHLKAFREAKADMRVEAVRRALDQAISLFETEFDKIKLAEGAHAKNVEEFVERFKEDQRSALRLRLSPTLYSLAEREMASEVITMRRRYEKRKDIPFRQYLSDFLEWKAAYAGRLLENPPEHRSTRDMSNIVDQHVFAAECKMLAPLRPLGLMAFYAKKILELQGFLEVTNREAGK